VGTHAVLEDKVKFKNLGLAIIDEQHRFGLLNGLNFGLKIKFRPIFWS
jgi:ATP-dependent DNA helicase RecG